MSIINNYEYVVKNPDLTLDHRIKNIIAGFPGVGKSTAANNKHWIFVDMESSDYHWCYDGSGNKLCHPEWPINYVDAIMEAARDMMQPQLYILISTHNEVLTELDRRGIYYNAVLPKSKDIYLQRYRERGNSEEFIAKLDSNFDSFIKSVEDTKVFGIYYTDDYLINIFVRDSENEYPYKVLLDYDKADICSYEFKVQNMPITHTNRPIIAVVDPAMIRDYNKYLRATRYDAYLNHLNSKDITTVECSYTDFIKYLANSPLYEYNCVFVEATEEVIMSFHKDKLNFILAVPATYVPKVHTCISSRYGTSKELFDAYIGVLKCYAFRIMISDFYIDDVYEHVPNFDSICIIKAINTIIAKELSETTYDPEKEALPFREIIHEYLVYTEDLDDDSDGNSDSLSGSEILENLIAD